MKKSIRVNSVYPTLVKTKIVPEAIQNALVAYDDMVPAIGEPWILPMLYYIYRLMSLDILIVKNLS